MKKLATLLLTAGMLLGASAGAHAIDFKAKGEMSLGFGYMDTMFHGQNGSDTFAAVQRIRFQIDAIASESLSGTVHFEIGDTHWGHNSSGGALGADGKIVELKHAYIDWFVPNTELKFRMGLQWFQNPEAAGGPAVLGVDGAGIVASYRINDNVSITTTWMRPYNDNYTGGNDENESANYLDNYDLFMLSVPVSFNGFKMTPWAMVGAMGRNVGESMKAYPAMGVSPIMDGTGIATSDRIRTADPYATTIWAGIPIVYTNDRLNLEFDFNYGATTHRGNYTQASHIWGHQDERVAIQRSGFVVKALAEYRLDWGTPGIFAWYGSGDDGDLSNGSERMPYVAPDGWYSTFVGDAAWSISDSSWKNTGYDLSLSYSGSWGIGLHVKDMSFLEDLSHTFRVVYWGGTNDPENANYLDARRATHDSYGYSTGDLYLTSNDYLLEFNLDSTYKIYDNLTATMQLGYIVNGIDEGTWNPDGRMDSKWGGNRDGYKAALVFKYKF